MADTVRDDNKMRLLDDTDSTGVGVGVGQLMRAWEHKGEHLSDFASPGKFVNLHRKNSNYGIDDDDEHYDDDEEGGIRMFARGQRYTHRLLHSNRIKFGLMNCVLLAVIVLGVSIGLSSNKDDKGMEEMEKFNAMNQGLGGGMTSSSQDDEDATIAAGDMQFEYEIATYQPMEFDRASGWMGKTYLEAYEFCKGVMSKDDKMGMYDICPYIAICPLGQGTFPVIGYKEDASWIPISDMSNDWVNLGKKNSCDRYSHMNEFPPEWGMHGDMGEDTATGRILCCLSSPYVPGPLTVTVGAGAEGTLIGYDEGDSDDPNVGVYENLISQFLPLEFDRTKGWFGQTYLEAYELCGSMEGYGLCPYGVICPFGYDTTPLGGIKYGTNDSWVPIEGPADWVQLGQDDTCAKYTSVHPDLPGWGVSGVGNEEITRHVICCAVDRDAIPPGTVSSTAVDDVPEDPASTDNQVTQEAVDTFGQIYMSTGDLYQPKGFDRNTGWTGRTYEAAKTFCLSVGDGYDLCPFEALCPMGHDTTPILGYATTEEGEQWVPIFDVENDWVAVHQGQACLRFTAMNPSVPEWGVTGEGSDAFTRELVCCLLQGDGGPEVVEGSSSPSMQEVHVDAVEEHYSPQYYNRESDWNGQTYIDAVMFCEAMHGKICPYEALCPLGLGSEPLWGYDKWDGIPGQTWVPISDTGDDFVQVSEENNTCVRYSAMHGASPDWGDSGEQFTRNIACCKGSMLGDAEESFVYQSTALLYHPIRYNRVTGYMGQTYQDAVSFCLTKSSLLCPYAAYCPFANLDTPLGGVATDEPGGSWAPISDMDNSWISIGLNNTCEQYRVIFGEAPSWGITGEGNEELTRHVMCCDSTQTASGEVEVDVVMPTVAVEGGDGDDSQVSGEEEVSVVMPTVAVGGGDEVDLVYQSTMLLYNPSRFDRLSGYTGQTYQDAVSFCSAKSLFLCPYAAYCPCANLDSPLGGEVTDEPNGSWAPISDIDNSWISIGLNNTCEQYQVIFGEAPLWGITGEGNEELTRHVMCCDTQTASGEVEVDVVMPTVAVEGGEGDDSQEVPLDTDAMEGFEEAYTNAEIYSPVWYNRTSGWYGFTYDDAFTFCSAKGSNHDICPYEVLCPGGPFQVPYGGSINGGLIESWVPINGAFNSWVQVITDGQVCVPWETLNGGGRPSWGMDSSELDEDITRYILCCEMYALSDNTASSTGSSVISYDDVSEIYAPIWYDRSDGWDGSKYVDAIVFCASKNSYIPCPYEAYCPFGAKSDSLDMAQGVWAAIMDSPNSWISKSCVQYSSLHNSPPLWGLIGGASSDMTPQIMCCKEPDDHAFAEIGLTNVSVATTAADEEIMKEWDPVWFSTKHGYRGTTYSDAIDFCKNIANMVLCPKKAYCSDMHLYLGKAPFQGEQWAPVATEDGTSEWISVGESAVVCATHEDMLLPVPEWITDGSEHESKQNVLCCQNPQHLEKELSLTNDVDPLWMDAIHGWAGGSHDDANKFCESFNFRRLCPYSAYCPHGMGQEPMGGHATDFNTEGEMWAPLYGTANHWVMIGQKYQNRATTCMDNYQLEGEEPSWGLSFERQELKKYIMCCKF